MVGAGVQRTFSRVNDAGTSGQLSGGGGIANDKDVAAGEGADVGGEVWHVRPPILCMRPHAPHTYCSISDSHSGGMGDCPGACLAMWTVWTWVSKDVREA